MNPKHILIVSGEPSGDLHASNLVKDLKRLNPNLNFFGIGGNLSKNAGVEIIFDISGLALVGVVEVIKNISVVKKAYDSVIAKIDSEKTDLAILVDYPGFNLRLAKALRMRSIPVVYYISPQVWAWGKNRINIIKKCVKKIIVFFGFEEELYKRYGVNVKFVGHPLLDVVKPGLARQEVLKKYGLSDEKTTISLLPGSRSLEIKSLLPTMAEAARLINERMAKTQFIVSKHPDIPMRPYEEAMKNAGVEIKTAEGDAYDILGASDFAIVASGTATLETAIIGIPLVIVYKANLFTYLLYKLAAKTRFLGLVNIIAQKEVVPELLQFDFTPEKIADTVASILRDKKRLCSMREDLNRLRDSLGAPGASLRAAQAILPLLQ